MRPQSSSHSFLRLPLSLLVLILAPLSHAEETAGWPEGWLFRTNVTAPEKAESYDILLEHGGVAQPDARDIRVVSFDKKPVSHFVSFADGARCRILFDGAAGPGAYAVYYGNLSPKLPPVPAGVSPFGRKEWSPKGGFTSASYDPLAPVDGRALLNLKNVMIYYENVVALAQATEKQNTEKESNPAKQKKSTAIGIYPNANTMLNAPDPWFHIFRAEINVPVAGKYDFVIGNGLQNERFGVLFIDGDRANAAVPGWFTINFSPICVGITGGAKLTAGNHVLEMYTNRRNPEIRMGLSGSAWKMPEYINGLSASFIAAKLTLAEASVQQGTLGEGYKKIINEWLAQERFTVARALCMSLKDRFASDAEMTRQFATASDRVNAAAYERSWMTEGKFPSRSGAVNDTTFAPPLKAVPLPSTNMHDDKPHASNSVWVEGRHIYGLPYNIQDLPWGVTSSICIEGDVLFVGTKNGVMHAVELSKVTERWSFQSGGPCLGPPLAYQGVLYYGGLDRRLYAIDIESGRMAWNFPANGWIEGGACASNGRVYFGSLDKNLYAIDAALGIQRWKTSLDGQVCATPSTDGKLIYVGTKSGHFFAVDAGTGSIVWKYATGAPIMGGCCIGKARVSFGDMSGRMHCLNTDTGKLVWNTPCDVGAGVMASPILVGHVLYGGTSDGKLFGIDMNEGTVGWSETMPGNGEIARPPLFADGKLVFTSKMRGLFGSPTGTPAVVAFEPGFNQQACLQTAGDITVDGKLSEASWQKALRLPLLRSNGLAAAGVNEARLLWDAKNLYVAVTCSDVDLVASLADRDGNLGESDSVTLLINPRNDDLATYEFKLSPRGVIADALILAMESDLADPKIKQAIDALKLEKTGAAWNPVWTSAVNVIGTVRSPEESRTDQDTGWSAEIAIPFESLPKSIAPPAAHGARWRIALALADRSEKTGAKPVLLSVSPPVEGKTTTALAPWPVLQFLQDKVKP